MQIKNNKRQKLINDFVTQEKVTCYLKERIE